MFSVKTNIKVNDDICKFQKSVKTIEPLIHYLKRGGRLINTFNLQEIFKEDIYFEKNVRKMNGELNKKKNNEKVKYNPIKDDISISFLIAISENDTFVEYFIPYMAVSTSLTKGNIKKIEGSLHLDLIKLTDNLYRLQIRRNKEK